MALLMNSDGLEYKFRSPPIPPFQRKWFPGGVYSDRKQKMIHQGVVKIYWWGHQRGRWVAGKQENSCYRSQMWSGDVLSFWLAGS